MFIGDFSLTANIYTVSAEHVSVGRVTPPSGVPLDTYMDLLKIVTDWDDNGEDAEELVHALLARLSSTRT